MANIKLTGFSGGRTSTIGDTDTATIAGSLAIGDDTNEDTVTVNAEFLSDLVPDVTQTYDLGSPAKEWKDIYGQTLHGDGANITGVTAANSSSFSFFGHNGLVNSTTVVELKTVNGSQNQEGWCIPVAGTATSMSFQCRCTSYTGDVTIKIELMVNGEGVPDPPGPCTLTTVVTGSGNITMFGSIPTVNFNAGDRIGVDFNHESTGITTQDHAVTVQLLT
jgi:hypothetical protein